MTIKEVEKITNLPRSNIRFYEKEKLISPARNTSNGYREYSEEDIKSIKKISYLRTLGISIEDIRKLSNKEANLYDVVKIQKQNLEQQLYELGNAKIMCERMLSSNKKIDYEDLDIEVYVTNVKDYWRKNSNTFKLDSVSFFYMWGGNITWVILTIACFLTAVVAFGHLPAKIPVQWNNSVVSSLVNKEFIFAFPVVCVVFRFALRPFIWRWLKTNMGVIRYRSDSVTDYITNYLCFVALSVEIFIILYVKEIVKHVTIIILIDTFVLIGILLMAVYKATRKIEL